MLDIFVNKNSASTGEFNISQHVLQHNITNRRYAKYKKSFTNLIEYKTVVNTIYL